MPNPLHSTTSQNRGFTIVELLIVIVVIAILAAITIVVFNGIQDRAIESSMKSDLGHATKLAEAYNAINGQYSPSLESLNEGQGFQASKDNEIAYTSDDGTSYCITVTRGEKSFNASNTQSDPQSGACPGHGPVTAAQMLDYSSAQFEANTTNSLSLSTPIQSGDVLVVLHYEHYILGTASLRVNGTPVTAAHSRSIGPGARVVRVTIVSGLTSSDTLDFRTDGSTVRVSHYLLRNVNNPSSVNIAAAGWSAEGDNGTKNSGFVRTISGGQTLKTGQVAILAYAGYANRIDEFSTNTSPEASKWTLHDSVEPYNAITIGTEKTPVPVAVNMLVTVSITYIAGSVIVIGS